MSLFHSYLLDLYSAKLQIFFQGGAPPFFGIVWESIDKDPSAEVLLPYLKGAKCVYLLALFYPHPSTCKTRGDSTALSCD